MGAPSDRRVVSVVIPAKSEYVSLVRLALVAVCRLTPLSSAEVADLKLAVGEAATTWIGPPAAPGEGEPKHGIRFSMVLEAARLLLEVSCPDPQAVSRYEREVGRAIMEATVDECRLEPGSVRLVKYLATGAQ